MLQPERSHLKQHWKQNAHTVVSVLPEAAEGSLESVRVGGGGGGALICFFLQQVPLRSLTTYNRVAAVAGTKTENFGINVFPVLTDLGGGGGGVHLLLSSAGSAEKFDHLQQSCCSCRHKDGEFWKQFFLH